MLGVLIILPTLYFFTYRLNLQVLHWLIERTHLMPVFLIVVFRMTYAAYWPSGQTALSHLQAHYQRQ